MRGGGGLLNYCKDSLTENLFNDNDTKQVHDKDEEEDEEPTMKGWGWLLTCFSWEPWACSRQRFGPPPDDAPGLRLTMPRPCPDNSQGLLLTMPRASP